MNNKINALCICLFFLMLPAQAQSEELGRASGDAWNASADLMGASLNLSGEVALAVGEPLADIVVAVAKGTGVILQAGAVMSLDVTSAGLDLATRPLAFSADVLSYSGNQKAAAPVVKEVTVMTAGDALTLMRAVESKDGMTAEAVQLLKSLNLNPQTLAGSVLLQEGLEQFSKNPDRLVFAIKADDVVLLVGLEQLEEATRIADGSPIGQ